MRLRCPWCANRRTFLRGWFRRYPRCRTCGIAWQREEGFELGAVTMNTMITFGAIVVGMAAGLVLTAPDIPVVLLCSILAGIAVVVPVLIYPFTYTVWLAFDLATHPPEVVELAEATTWVAANEG